MNRSAQPTEPDVSFVVIAYNEEANIGSCLSSIISQVGGASLEVVVVDDGSDDATASLVAKAAEVASERADIVLIEHQENLGRGAARQTGIAAARGALIAMVDADIVLPEDWLARSQAAMETYQADAVGGIAVPDGDVTYVCNRFALQPRSVPPTIPVSGNNGLYRRRVFDLVRIDPTLSEGEDVALNRAMEASGLRSCTLAELTVEHRESKGFLASLRWLYRSGIGASRQLTRYRQVRMPDLVFAGHLGTLVFSVTAARRGANWRIAWSVPCAYLVLASGAHMAKKFEVKGEAGSFALATATNTVLLGAYIAGRVMGIPLSRSAQTGVDA
jgi:glycosyltransferase involved in cell wall biosynthesis